MQTLVCTKVIYSLTCLKKIKGRPRCVFYSETIHWNHRYWIVIQTFRVLRKQEIQASEFFMFFFLPHQRNVNVWNDTISSNCISRNGRLQVRKVTLVSLIHLDAVAASSRAFTFRYSWMAVL